MIKVTMGCDPELFLFDKKKDRIVPAIGIVGGTKDEPIPIDGGSYQLDGTLIEFGIDPDGDIGKVVNGIRSVLSKQYGDRYELRCGDTVAYHPDDIPSTHPSLSVGCSPQFQMLSETKIEQVRGRTRLDPKRIHAGGHIHVGFTKDMDIADPALLKPCYDFTKMLRRSSLSNVGGRLRSSEVFSNTSGVIRVKPYGFEWRNPSSLWLANRRVFNVFGEMFQRYIEELIRHPNRNDFLFKVGQIRNLIRSLERVRSGVADKYQRTLPLDY